MKIIADFHLHSKYSRATSKNMDIEHLARGAKIKGIDMLGTGDFTHPAWLTDLKENLEPIDSSGIFKSNGIFWMLTTEVSTVYMQEGMLKKVHHVIHAPDFDTVDQVNEALSKHGNLSSDGRPTFSITSPELVEILMQINKNILVLPAHAWTPWFSMFGSRSGFDSMEECYQDQMKNIFALETGLSSDPPMNWRLSKLDKITLMSNSDSHSPNPWRLGREANVFDLEEVSYKEIYNAVKEKDKKKFLFTIEVDPSYGKYHFDGHRNCGISMSPEEAKRFNNICPKCKRKLVIGVLHRVEDLADRPEGFVPDNAIPFKSLLPLYEIISFASGTGQLYSKKSMEEQDKLIGKFGNELSVLLDVPEEELEKVTDHKIVDAIIKIREGKVKFVPGYDGVYGKPILTDSMKRKVFGQRSLKEF